MTELYHSLTDVDIKVLECIDDNYGADSSLLFEHFAFDHEIRLEKLIEYGYVEDYRNRTAADDKAQHLGLYVTTKKGKALLKDVQYQRQVKNEEFWRSILIPSLITVSINLLMHGLPFLIKLILR